MLTSKYFDGNYDKFLDGDKFTKGIQTWPNSIENSGTLTPLSNSQLEGPSRTPSSPPALHGIPILKLNGVEFSMPTPSGSEESDTSITLTKLKDVSEILKQAVEGGDEVENLNENNVKTSTLPQGSQ